MVTDSKQSIPRVGITCPRLSPLDAQANRPGSSPGTIPYFLTLETNDKFRGQVGAFDKALAGIRNCIEAGIKVGLRPGVLSNRRGDIRNPSGRRSVIVLSLRED